ncbi:MAG: bis(5'-nucleosyl)-tetraphosphatase [Oscillospiraceae bacterium]
MTYEKSCGAVVFTRAGGEIRYVLAQSLAGVYGFPKGHVEAGETEQETALREIWEEVHLKPRLIEGFRTTSVYMLPNKKGVLKRVVFFLAEYEEQEIVAQKEELRSAPLVPYEEAMKMLRHRDTRRILREANDFLHNGDTPSS